MERATNLDMHPSVKKVAEFMQREVPADELRGVANAIALLAPSIWGRHPEQHIQPLELAPSALTSGAGAAA